MAAKMYLTALKEENLLSGFRRAGIWPFTGIEAVPRSRITRPAAQANAAAAAVPAAGTAPVQPAEDFE